VCGDAGPPPRGLERLRADHRRLKEAEFAGSSAASYAG
jgi:hypothetical protein